MGSSEALPHCAPLLCTPIVHPYCSMYVFVCCFPFDVVSFEMQSLFTSCQLTEVTEDATLNRGRSNNGCHVPGALSWGGEILCVGQGVQLVTPGGQNCTCKVVEAPPLPLPDWFLDFLWRRNRQSGDSDIQNCGK